MGKEKITADIVISGSGVMGLMLARNLSRNLLGDDHRLDVVVLEKARKIAAGSSIRNEGWLHAGTYHSVAIRNESDASSVVERTKYGYNWIRQNAPGVIEDPSSHTYALFADQDSIDPALQRWRQMSVGHQPVTKSELASEVPNLRIENVREGFQVEDTSINTARLYRQLVAECRENGVRFLTGTQITGFEDNNTAAVESASSDIGEIKGGMFLHTVGYGLKEVLNRLGIDASTRFWKSHLMVTPRLSRHHLFFLEERQAGVMHHLDQNGRERSIVGTNVDAIFLDEPDTDVVSTKADELESAAGRMYSDWGSVNDRMVYACVKTDVAASDELPKLTPFTWAPKPNHLCILPGKMTEAPYVADRISEQVFTNAALYIFGRTPSMSFSFPDRNAFPEISPRPCDTMAEV